MCVGIFHQIRHYVPRTSIWIVLQQKIWPHFGHVCGHCMPQHFLQIRHFVSETIINVRNTIFFIVLLKILQNSLWFWHVCGHFIAWTFQIKHYVQRMSILIDLLLKFFSQMDLVLLKWDFALNMKSGNFDIYVGVVWIYRHFVAWTFKIRGQQWKE